LRGVRRRGGTLLRLNPSNAYRRSRDNLDEGQKAENEHQSSVLPVGSATDAGTARIDRNVMVITEAEASLWHAAPHKHRSFRTKYKGERVMIEILALALVSVAVGVPALIAATMLGSKLNLYW
jgi:hypothetical protein